MLERLLTRSESVNTAAAGEGECHAGVDGSGRVIRRLAFDAGKRLVGLVAGERALVSALPTAVPAVRTTATRTALPK